jgi:hypothetical protein
MLLRSIRLLKKSQNGQFVMLNLFQHLVKSISYETLKQVQGDRNRLFQQPDSEKGIRSRP